MAAIENAEDGIVFSSGMAAILTSMFAMLKSGDHIIFQNDLYGGTHFAAFQQLGRYGIEFTMVDAADPGKF
ncbi:MAG: PLP-dependent transferase [Bacteroidota bacterium]